MRRRKFIAGLSLAAAIGSAQAERPGKVYRIAILDPGTPMEVMNESSNPLFPLWGPLFEELRRLGYVEGQNLTVERYSGRSNYTPDLTRKVVARNPDLIFVVGNPVARDLLAATQTIPVVGIVAVSVMPDLVANLAHPGRNFTGVSIEAGSGVLEKHLELLRQILPNMTRVGLLVSRAAWKSGYKAVLEKSVKNLGLVVVGPFLENPVTEAEFRRVLSAMSEERVDAIEVSPIPEVFAQTPRVIRFAQEFRLPAIYSYRYFAQIGGLMAYDYGHSDLGRSAADQIDQILKGTKPGDIPIYQAKNFTLSINLKTAKALGLTVPVSLLARADEVIE